MPNDATPAADQPALLDNLLRIDAKRFYRLVAIEQSHADLAETLTGMVALFQAKASDPSIQRDYFANYHDQAINRLGNARRLSK